jgi:hypothetical protein
MAFFYINDYKKKILFILQVINYYQKTWSLYVFFPLELKFLIIQNFIDYDIHYLFKPYKLNPFYDYYTQYGLQAALSPYVFCMTRCNSYKIIDEDGYYLSIFRRCKKIIMFNDQTEVEKFKRKRKCVNCGCYSCHYCKLKTTATLSFPGEKLCEKCHMELSKYIYGHYRYG